MLFVGHHQGLAKPNVFGTQFAQTFNRLLEQICGFR